MNTYTITKGEPIAIYGGGRTGLNILHRLKNAGYNVVCIIDRNPNFVYNSTVPVYYPSDGYRKFGDIFVYISLISGDKHLGVANYLRNIGYHKVLFLPLYISSHGATTMSKIWRSFFEGIYHIKIPYFEDLWTIRARDYTSKEHSDFVNVVVHKDHIFTQLKSDYSSVLYASGNPYWSHISEVNDQLICKLDRPITDQSTIWEHITIIPFREGVMSLLNGFLFDPSQFYDILASQACFNKNGYFNLLDGHHRCFYLVDHGFTGIPLRVLKTDWELYFREQEAQALMNYCKNMDALPMEVKHPAFVRFPVKECEPDSQFKQLYHDLYPWD